MSHTFSSSEFTEKAALALAPSFRDRFDFSVDEHFKLFSDLTWKTAKALSAKRDAEIAQATPKPVAAPAPAPVAVPDLAATQPTAHATP